jgi:hypothetical protein
MITDRDILAEAFLMTDAQAAFIVRHWSNRGRTVGALALPLVVVAAAHERQRWNAAPPLELALWRLRGDGGN